MTFAGFYFNGSPVYCTTIEVELYTIGEVVAYDTEVVFYAGGQRIA